MLSDLERDFSKFYWDSKTFEEAVERTYEIVKDKYSYEEVLEAGKSVQSSWLDGM